VNGIELNFISLQRNFKIYIQGEMLLPLILVRSQIKNMLGGETGKKGEKNKVKFRNSSKKGFLSCAINWYIVRMWTARLLVLSL